MLLNKINIIKRKYLRNSETKNFANNIEEVFALIITKS